MFTKKQRPGRQLAGVPPGMAVCGAGWSGPDVSKSSRKEAPGAQHSEGMGQEDVCRSALLPIPAEEHQTWAGNILSVNVAPSLQEVIQA